MTEKMMYKSMIEKIEYESVTVKMPKAVMDLLRYAQSITGNTPDQDIAYYAVESVKSRIEVNGFSPSPKALAAQFNLNPVFKEILDDTIAE